MQLTVGQRIRRLREERGIREGTKLTQQWLADQLKVSKSAVIKWERDIQQPGADSVLALARLFDVPPDTFVSQGTVAQDGSGTTENPPGDVLDLWGLSRARAVEKLIDYLQEDRRVHELRAEAALNASRAAVLEAEKAPDRSRPGGVSSDRLEEMIAEAFEARRNAEAGGVDSPTEKRGKRGKQPPAEER